jgi:hypothetical protein
MTGRRQFLAWVAGAVPAAVFIRRAHAAAIAEINAAPQTLDALGLAILPTELGEAQTKRVVASFRRWLDQYREGAELLHPYGGSRLSVTGPTPATRWLPQLDTLEAASLTTYGAAFSAVGIPERRALVREALSAERSTGFPAPDRASHVATALLGFFYATPQATDLCYEAAIGRNTCRPLAKSPDRPTARPPLSPGRDLPVFTSIDGGS